MLSATDMSMLANTFLDVVVKETRDANGLIHTHLAEDLSGKSATPIDNRDYACDGWLNLAEFNSLVYNKCETVTLHQWDPSINTTRGIYQPHPQRHCRRHHHQHSLT
jgi:hypothetical protein